MKDGGESCSQTGRCSVNPISEGKEDGGMREGEKNQGIRAGGHQETLLSCAA